MIENLIRVLIIDDDELDRKLLKRLLRADSTPMEFFEVTDGEAGLAMLMEQGFDCVFMDYQLPKKDGIQILQEVRHKKIDTPIIIMTGQGGELLAAEMMRTGANDYIPKNNLTGELVSKSLHHVIRVAAAERLAHASEERFRRAVTLAPFPMMIYTDDGEVIHLSDTWTEITGYTHHDIPTVKAWTAKAYPVQQETMEQEFEAIYDIGERVEEGEYSIVTKEGEVRIWAFSAAPLGRLPDGRRAVISMAVDVTDRRRMEDMLKDSRERFQALVKQSSEGMIVFETQSGRRRIVEVNAACVKMFGYQEEELLTMTFDDIACSTPLEIELMVETLRVHGRYSFGVGSYCHKKGHQVYAERNGSLIQYQGERLIMITYRDITKERRLQEIIQSEVELAGNVQRMMVPIDYEDERVRIRTIYESVHLVSGDFFGYCWSQDKNYLHGYVLDVTGHGMATALQTSAASTLLNRAMSREDPWNEEVLRILNRQLTAYFPEGSYAALLAFTLDFKKRRLVCVSGGINGFMAALKTQPEKVVIPGSFLGLVDDPAFETLTISVQAGDKFYFMTDGLYERVDQDVIGKGVVFEDALQALKNIAVAENRHDDCSALCVEITEQAFFPVTFLCEEDEQLPVVRQHIRELLRLFLSEEAMRVEIALNEAVMNARRQGDVIRIRINKIGGWLIFRIADNGQGFTGNNVLQTLRTESREEFFEEHLMDEHGRGIPIMMAWMDRVIYNQQGTEVLMMKRIP